jgi:hypothetical protein
MVFTGAAAWVVKLAAINATISRSNFLILDFFIVQK